MTFTTLYGITFTDDWRSRKSSNSLIAEKAPRRPSYSGVFSFLWQKRGAGHTMSRPSFLPLPSQQTHQELNHLNYILWVSAKHNGGQREGEDCEKSDKCKYFHLFLLRKDKGLGLNRTPYLRSRDTSRTTNLIAEKSVGGQASCLSLKTDNIR